MPGQCWRHRLAFLEMLRELLGTGGSMEKEDRSPGTPQRELKLCSRPPAARIWLVFPGLPFILGCQFTC